MNKNVITPEMVNETKEGLKGILELAEKGGTVLIDEAVKLYIFYGVIGVLKAATVFVLLFIVNKFVSTMIQSTNDKKETTVLKAGKTLALIISIVYFASMSLPHLSDIGKVLVAPNLFLAEKGFELVKGNK